MATHVRNKQYLFQEWQKLESAIIPPEAPATVRTAMKRSFYAGARAVFAIQADVMAREAVSGETIDFSLGHLVDEIDVFARSEGISTF